MEYEYGTEGYYKKMLELQERLRKSEEERLILEEKFNEMMLHSRDVEHDRLRLMRHRYHKFLEEDKIRQERNENILRALDRIDSRAKMLAAKTSRFKAFRKQYESYIKRIHRPQTEQQPSFQNIQPSQPDRNYTHSNVRKKLFSDISLPAKDESVENKLAVLEQYLRDNFDNFPQATTKPQNNTLHGNQINEENEYAPNRKSFYNQNKYERHPYFDPPDSDSKESQEAVDECNKYTPRQFNGKSSPKINVHEETQNKIQPTKSELLGKTIEQELERLKKKEPIKQISLQKENSFEKQPEQVIQDYKDLVSKSEEKYGLRGESPVRRNKDIYQGTNSPNIFDNASKTLNIEQLKNLATPRENTDDKLFEKDIINSKRILQENVDSESENPVIKNYKNMLKSLQDDEPADNNNLNVNDEIKPAVSNNVQENTISELSKQDDNTEKTEPPSDVSLNLSSHKPEDQVPIEQIITDQNINKQMKLDYNNDDSIQNSVDESTIKEHLQSEPVKEENKLSENLKSSIQELSDSQNVIDLSPSIDNQNNQSQVILEEEVNQETNQDKAYEEQNYPQETFDNQLYSEEYDTKQSINQLDPQYQEGYDLSQQNLPDYQESYEQNISQPEYQEGYEQQHIADQQSFDVTQSNMLDQQPDYQEGYDMAQQNISDPQIYDVTQSDQQPEYQEGYDSQQNPNYQEGYDGQYYDQQQKNQQYSEGQEVYQEGYDQQYPPEQYTEQQQEAYDLQQYPADQEYADQGYQHQEYSQEYTDQQYPPEGSENVYHSEQEYLQGEQNIDNQYENEQNQEYQPQDYPENYPEQENQGQPQLEQQESNVNLSENNVNLSESTEKSSSEIVDIKPLVEKTLPNLADMLDTDTESIKQDTKISNDSDFNFSKS